LIHDEPLVGSSGFWFTRPIARKTGFSVKTIFVVLLLVFPPLAAEIIVSALNDVTARHIMLSIPEILLEKLSFILPILILASLTQSFGGFAIAGAIVIVSYLILGLVIFFAALIRSEMARFMVDMSLTLTRGVISNIIIIVCGAAIVFHQYLTRKTVRTIIGVVILFVISTAVTCFWPWDFLKGKTISAVGKILPESVTLIPHPDTLWVSDLTTSGSS
jgi:hypothetical protein